MEEERKALLDEGLPRRRWPTRLMACLLLAIMLCTVLTTPLVVFYRWNNERKSRVQPQPAATAVAAAEGLNEDSPAAEPLKPTEAAQTSERVARVNRIAYITLDQQLSTITPAGLDERRLTDRSERFQFPAWSPDGSSLAVIGGNSVYVLADDATGGQPTRLYENQEESPFYLYWSPNGRSVSFLANHPEGIALHISQVDAEGPASRILSVGQPLYWDWTPEADGIFIHTGLTGDEARLALIDPGGDGDEANIAEPGLFQAPGIARSGRYWAYAQVDADGNSQLVVRDQEGEAQVIENHFGQVAMNWSPERDVLAYTSPTIDSGAFYGPLHLYDAETGKRQTLSPNIVVAYFWSPDGRRIGYFTLPDGDRGGTQAAGRLVRTSFTMPAQREDVKLDLWVVDVETGFSRLVSTFGPSPLFVTQFLPFFDQYALSHRIWSPDSDAIVLPMQADGQAQIVVVDVESGETQAIADGVMAFWSQQ